MHAAAHQEYDPYDDDDDLPQAEPGRGWRTHPAAEILNSLCPAASIDDFPRFDWLEPHEREDLKNAMTYGFNAMRDHFEADYADRVLISGVTDGERLALHHIKRKTLAFGKLCEAMTLGSFTKGARDRNGELLRTKTYGTIVSCGVIKGAPVSADQQTLKRWHEKHKANAARAIRGLLAKALVDRAHSEWQSSSSVSYVYCPMPYKEAVQIMLRHAENRLSSRYPRRAQVIMNGLRNYLVAECADFLQVALLERQAASAKKAVQPVATDGEDTEHKAAERECSGKVRSLARQQTVVSTDNGASSGQTTTRIEDFKLRRGQVTGDFAPLAASHSSRSEQEQSLPGEDHSPPVSPAPSRYRRFRA